MKETKSRGIGEVLASTTFEEYAEAVGNYFSPEIQLERIEQVIGFISTSALDRFRENHTFTEIHNLLQIADLTEKYEMILLSRLVSQFSEDIGKEVNYEVLEKSVKFYWEDK